MKNHLNIKKISIFFAFILVFIMIKIFNYSDANSATNSTIITSKTDWEAGTLSADIDSTRTVGSIEVKAEYQIDLSTVQITATCDTTNKLKIIDGDTNTSWGLQPPSFDCANDPFNWNADLGSIYTISKTRNFQSSMGSNCIPMYGFGCGMVLETSTDNSIWTERWSDGNSMVWTENIFTSSVLTRYLKIHEFNDINDGYIREFEIYSSPITATHTSATGQIGATGDSERKVVNWENFTATESEPTNSTIRYRFRKTNADGSWTGDWTDYVDHTGSAIDLQNYSQLTISTDDVSNGRTYLQVETKFTRTDASANPTVSDYSIGYHTNKRPNKPTGN